jgi:hypothetical protein
MLALSDHEFIVIERAFAVGAVTRASQRQRSSPPATRSSSS